MRPRHSIKIKIFTWIISLTFTFLFLSFFFTSLFLEPYSILRQKKSLLVTARNLSSLYIEELASLNVEMQRAERMKGNLIIVYSQDGSIEYNTMQESEWESNQTDLKNQLPPPKHQPGKNPPGIGPPPLLSPMDYSDIVSKLMDVPYIYMDTLDDFFNTRILYLYYRMDNGGIMQISSPLESMEESLIISGQFTFFTGIIDLVIGLIAAYFIAKFYTNPIKKLKFIAESMAGLDFSQKYENISNDEIGDLGLSINSLSDQLYHSISELSHINENLQDEIERKKQIDDMRKDFIASVSHELRTPLSLIKGFAEGLQDEVHRDKANKDFYCEVIIDETQKMERHVSSLLNLSQIQSGALPLEIKTFDLSQLIFKIYSKYEKKFEEKNISHSYHQAGSLMVSADPDKTEQILVNYLNNAINHMGGKRELALTITFSKDNKVRVKVRNTGIQIPNESLNKIWNSYYKVDKARTRQYGGYGLGLSIVQAIQEQYGNAYGVENYPAGVIFWFDLNLSAEDPA